MDDLRIGVSFIAGVADTDPAFRQMPWNAVKELFRDPATYPAKAACPLWKPCRFGDRRNAKGSRRIAENLDQVWGVMLDYDGGAVSIEQARDLAARAGVESIFYTTPSHTDDEPRWRAVLPLSEASPADQHERLVSLANGVLGGIAAPESWRPAQFFYYGHVAGSPYKFFETAGRCLDQLDPRPKPVGPPGRGSETASRGALAASSKPSLGLSSDEIRTALRPLDAEDYDQWLRVGLALHHETTGSDDGLALWDEWSRDSPNYAGQDDLATRWAGFGQSGTNEVTLRSFVPLAVRRRPRPTADLESLLAAAAKLTESSSSDEIDAVILPTATLHPADQSRVLKAAKAATGISVADLRRSLRVAADLDHLALATIVLDELGAENLVEAQSNLWRWRDEGLWTPVEPRELEADVQRILAARPGLPVTRRLVDGVAETLRRAVLDRTARFDSVDADVVNLRNGEQHWTGEDWELRPHCRENFFSSQIPAAYSDAAEAPRFERFLDEVFRGDADATEKKTAVLELLGYSLMRHTRYEKFPLLVGDGSNGKSVLLNLVRELVGARNTSAVLLDQLDVSSMRARLLGKLVNLSSEVKAGSRFPDDAVKALASGDYLTAAAKYCHPFEFRPCATLWLASNHMPRCHDTSDGVFRRAIVLRFNNRFSHGGAADPNLLEKLRDELPGILRLALDAYGGVIRRGGFTIPASSREAVEDWRLEGDSAMQFFDERVVRDAESRVSVIEAYMMYQWWARESGIRHPMTKRAFCGRMEQLGARRMKSGSARYLAGIRLSDAAPGNTTAPRAVDAAVSALRTTH